MERLVTVGIIAKNEEKHIGTILEQLKNQTYSHDKIEVILVNSMSTDTTKNIMNSFAKTKEFFGVKIFDNPKQTQASSWNIVIENASGDLIIRLDAHSLIPKDFVEQNVACIDSGESVCGGHRVNIISGNGLSEKILLAAENSMFGSSVAKYRNDSEDVYVKTIPHACYKKEVFEKCGVFNENLLRSEDNEMHFRIRQNGYKIRMSTKIYSEYQTRATLSGMLKQKYGNGKWIGITSMKETPSIFSLYHFVPLAFVLAAILATILLCVSIISWSSLWFLSIPFFAGVLVYALLDLALSIKGAKDNGILLAIAPLFILFPLLHFSYGFGTLNGIIMAPFMKFNQFKGVKE